MELLITLVLLVIGFVVGRAAEKKHYKSIREREVNYSNIPTINHKNFPVEEEGEIESVELATGSVAISMDYFKKFFMSLKGFFGGRLGEYETLIDRARREATLRMKESVPHADLIYNVRLETSSIGGQSSDGKGVSSIEVLVFGTAVKFKK